MNYKELIVWQKAHALSIKVISLTKSSGRSYTTDTIMKQLFRAATSVGANIAEGYGRHEGKEYVRFLQIAFSSANEVDNWLNVLKDSRSIDPSTASGLMKDNEEILKILATMMKRIKVN